MVIFGGLEIIAGGYLVHRYHKKQDQKKKLEEDAQRRRHNSFPGAKPQPYYPPQPQHVIPQQKYGYVAHTPPNRPQPPYSPPHRLYTEPPPHHAYGAPLAPQQQPFIVPRRPLPNREHEAQPQPQIIQPLQRADSFATISRMPIANGYRPSDIPDDPPVPPRGQNLQLSPIPQSPMHSPYGNANFAVSSPALGNIPTTPIYGSGHHSGRQTVDDNWETYHQGPGHAPYAPSVSTALGEHRDDDPPPPYRP